MTSMKEFAQGYSKSSIKNITELEVFRLDSDIEVKTYEKSDGEKFTVNETIVGTEKYRVPNSVVEQIQGILEAKPDCAAVKVTSKGSGMNTTYQVIPL